MVVVVAIIGCWILGVGSTWIWGVGGWRETFRPQGGAGSDSSYYIEVQSACRGRNSDGLGRSVRAGAVSHSRIH
jgi:hypothetical protein